MASVYCPRCETNVILEQDGRSCSNCGRELVIPVSPGKEKASPAAAVPKLRGDRPS